MTNHTATYSPDDNKLRLYPAWRLDAEEYARVKAAGFAWAPKQELFVAPMWTPEREDLLLELAGEIDDEDKSLVERAEERADRFGDYSDRRKADGDAAHKAVERIIEHIPLGQPILVGHHSERHARKDAQRIEDGMRRSIKMWKTAGYWKGRAAGAIQAAKYKELPAVRARRIKGIEADQRKQQGRRDDAEKALATWATIEAMDNDPEKQHAHALAFTGSTAIGSFRLLIDGEYRWSAWDVLLPDEKRYKACPSWTVRQVIDAAKRLYPRTIANCDRWLAHYANRLEYERAMLADQGGLVTDRFEIEIGGQVKVGREWLLVTRVNRSNDKIVSVTTNGRFGRVRGIEEVSDYKAPSAADTAAVKAATATPPLANYPGDGFVHITEAEWKGYPKDYRGTKEVAATETIGRHRVRYVHGTFIKPREKLIELAAARNETERSNIVHRWYSLFITDAKTVMPGAPVKVTPAKLPEQLPPDPRPQIDRTPDTVRQQIAQVEEVLKAGVKVAAVPQLFPTPAHVARGMVLLADIDRSHRVLEPSVGLGAIWREMSGIGCARVAVEINPQACDQLKAISTMADRIVCADFLEIHGPDAFAGDDRPGKDPRPLGKFDRIVMNPPFKDGADIRHIAHALQFLAYGGRLVAICANGPRQADKLKPLAATWTELPDGTFADQGTNVRTVLLTIETPEVVADPGPAITQTVARPVAAKPTQVTLF